MRNILSLSLVSFQLLRSNGVCYHVHPLFPVKGKKTRRMEASLVNIYAP